MTARVTGPDGRLYLHEPGGLEPVFVADQPRQRSAFDQPMTGFALLCGWLAREDARGQLVRQYAQVRREDGTTMPVAAGAVCGIAGLAARRILPRPAPRLVAQPAEVWR
jgi:hypothetical protein